MLSSRIATGIRVFSRTMPPSISPATAMSGFELISSSILMLPEVVLGPGRSAIRGYISLTRVDILRVLVTAQSLSWTPRIKAIWPVGPPRRAIRFNGSVTSMVRPFISVRVRVLPWTPACLDSWTKYTRIRKAKAKIPRPAHKILDFVMFNAFNIPGQKDHFFSCCPGIYRLLPVSGLKTQLHAHQKASARIGPMAFFIVFIKDIFKFQKNRSIQAFRKFYSLGQFCIADPEIIHFKHVVGGDIFDLFTGINCLESRGQAEIKGIPCIKCKFFFRNIG